ncbi:MAG: 50S ribosomal protein L21e [Candidatus Woesearchaeota archaeon]
MSRVGGSRRKTRYKLTKGVRDKGKVTITRHFQKFSEGEGVILKIEPSIQKGVFHPRHHGKKGTVIGMKGSCYIVEITDIHKQKEIIVHPVHMVKLNG